MNQYELIRIAHRVYGKSIREISREYGHHRSTVRKALAGTEPDYLYPAAPRTASLRFYKRCINYFFN